ncbi:methyltransferase domain-containing protein [Cristinia sonorae]|uniref:Methyltransferase domain-containing protein n=1 Tax=Cristinia sonorae TaxID=1940300 RepID=A0A8K0XKR2_9AGAR|nr:methyltransferase domain-containing protein [Cristinia sonorae]
MASPLRNPRNALLLIAFVAGVFYLLAPLKTAPPSNKAFGFTDETLPARVRSYERIYQKVLEGRAKLIQKFGPTPKDVAMFPPDKDPWPPYTVWDFFPPAFNCPHEIERVGQLGDGGKWVCGLDRLQDKPDCVIYSFGINGESSFEAEVLERTQHCQIWGYDFSVRSFGPQIPTFSLRRTHFKAYGLSGKDSHGPQDKPKMYTLQSLMEMNGHTHIDLLKIDVESWEFDVLNAFVKPYVESGKPLPFGQLSIELHLWNRKFPEFLAFWEMLEEAGLRPFFQEMNMVYNNYAKGGEPELSEYSFLNIKGNNVFVIDPPVYNVHGSRPVDY